MTSNLKLIKNFVSYAVFLFVTSWLNAGVYNQLFSSFGTAGERASSAAYSNQSGLTSGAVGGFSASGDSHLKAGYFGQVYEVSELLIEGDSESVKEASALQLRGRVILDDGSAMVLQSEHVRWRVVSGPIQEVSLFGVATTSVVASDMSATVGAVWHGYDAFHPITVLDVIPDHYGSYAGDGISDASQSNYFGLNNSSALPLGDLDGDGQTNRFEFIAGLDPTDPLSFFRVRVSVGSGSADLTFHPVVPDKTYTVQFRESLLTGEWVELRNLTSRDRGAERTVVDNSAGPAAVLIDLIVSITVLSGEGSGGRNSRFKQMNVC